jgi:hypothetical protein
MQWLLLVFLVCDITHFALLSSQKTTCTPLPLELQFKQSKTIPAGVCESSPKGATGMDKERMAELEKIESHGSENGWVAPMTEEDRAFFAYFRSVFKRYNISPSKATRLEYDFVTRVAESEFYLQKANA